MWAVASCTVRLISDTMLSFFALEMVTVVYTFVAMLRLTEVLRIA